MQKSYMKSYYKKKNKEIIEEEIYDNPESNVGDAEVPSQQIGGDEIEYRVQLFTSPKKLKSNDSRIKNIDGINYYYENGLYKYTCGSVTDKKEALSLQKKMRKRFSQAFLVTFKNGKRIK